MPILRKSRVVRHLAIKAEPTESTVSEVKVNLFAQPTLRANAVAVADSNIRTSSSGSIEGRPVEL
jgi:hypothetical protein